MYNPYRNIDYIFVDKMLTIDKLLEISYKLVEFLGAFRLMCQFFIQSFPALCDSGAC